jgi:2-oxoglutarate dehydrogenase E1 component
MLLPHGYEGQGPDHSSARIERWLTMCADEAFVVAQPSTPASYFHLLRQHSLGEEHRPMVVFTPKSMLRLKAASSMPEEFTSGTFRPVLPDTKQVQDADRVILAAGKVVWDLEAERARLGDERTVILRVEQYYPLPAHEIAEAIEAHPGAELVWVQDEPQNQGAWPFMALNLPGALAGLGVHRPLRVVSRKASASPSTGSSKKHAQEQADLVAAAFAR